METRKKEIVVPTGKKYTIREQTGYDDEVLSQIASLDDADVINRFMAGIIQEDSEGNKISYEEVLDMKLRDKYVLLIASRIFSLGETLNFEYDWKDGTPVEYYQDDLAQYIWDYSQPFPEPGDPGYVRYRIKPYNPEYREKVEFEIDSQLFRFDILDGHGEKYLIKLQKSQIHINQELLARNFSLKEGDQWLRVRNFNQLTARQIAQVRSRVKMYDDNFEVLTQVEHPTTRIVEEIPIIGLRDFFFPSLL
jgi:hypothetical protein